jgi:hypothetical protein
MITLWHYQQEKSGNNFFLKRVNFIASFKKKLGLLFGGTWA